MRTMTDRVVLITGATGPLGRVAAGAVAEAGARLGLGGTDAHWLSDLAGELGLPDDQWVAAVGDLTKAEGAAAARTAVEERFGPIDVLLHLAGGWAGGTPVVELDHEDVRGMQDQHLWSTLHMVQAVAPGMVERGWGRIVAISSPFAVSPGPKGASYAIAKAAEEVLLRSLAREVANSGVTANLVALRTLDAKYQREAAPSQKNAASTTPDEVTRTLLFLASDDATSINGAVIPLDGRG